MNMQEAVDKLDHVDDLFGEISSSLVYICEELPSLELTKPTEDHIVGFCCTFLERLVEEDKSIQRIRAGIVGNVDRLPHTRCCPPEGARATIEKTAQELRQHVQSMDSLVDEYRRLATERSGLKLLCSLLGNSGVNVRKAFEGIRGAFDSILEEWSEEKLRE